MRGTEPPALGIQRLMIVGMAGHIDHGKTALVKALTGVDTDRLPQEQARGISIDLGFAYQARDDGGVTGFVDMPGHEKFMRNMLVGAAGIDCLLLVIAADDGVMPQTREHLAVAGLLGVDRGMALITKVDLADEARLKTVRAEVADLLPESCLAGADILAVSAKDSRGIAELQAALDGFAAEENPNSQTRIPQAPARLVVDRSFSISGSGTVVSGMLVQGHLSIGDHVLTSPSGLPVRIRSLHAQNQPCDIAYAGQRCGVSLGGRIAADEIMRGDWLLAQSLHEPTGRIDVMLHLLDSETRPLRHWSAVRFHHGAAQVAGRVAILQEGPLLPGQSCMAQLVLERPVAASVNDRFVIRAGNGERSLGGGRLIDLRPPSRRRKQPRRLAQLSAMALADPAQSLAAQTGVWPFYIDSALFQRDRAIADQAMQALLEDADLSAIEGDGRGYILHSSIHAKLEECALEVAHAYHQKHPRLLGAGLKHLQRSCDPALPLGPMQALLEGMVKAGKLARDGGVYRLPAHHLGLDRQDDALWQKARPLLAGEARFRPPLLAELAEKLACREFDLRRVLTLKAREGRAAEIAQGRFFLEESLHEIAAIIGEISQAAEGGIFGAADLRDRLENGRKVAIEVLEYFDRQAMTARRGDNRVVDAGRLQGFIEQTEHKSS